MSFGVVATAVALSQFAPMIARWIDGEESENIAHEVVRTARKLTGEKGQS